MSTSCPRTLLTLIVLMVVVQLFTSLLLKLAARSGLSARTVSASRSLKRRLFTRNSSDTSSTAQLWTENHEPTVVFRNELQDRSGLEGINMPALIEDMQSITANLSSMTRTPPLALPYANNYNNYGLVGFVAGDGKVRTEYATIPDGTVADVIDIHRRRI